ncbi:hypothetical protein [Pectobacterium brasiliense]|uniref:hypothetical protein n=1 Tax=Pectobacterium brasiliense TaxID=180957 RepID=UPI0032EC3BC9
MTTLTNAARLPKSRIEEIKNGSVLLMGESKDLAATALHFIEEFDKAIVAFRNAAQGLLVAEAQLAEMERQEPVGIVEDSDYQTAAEPRRKAVRELYEGALVVGQKLYASQPAAIKPDAMLCDFYEVSNYPDLVRELVLHVEQLQESAKRDVKPWQDTFPETLLPAYIERIKKADDAVRANTAPNDYFSSLVSAARTRADKAIRKFPQPNYVLNKVAEENGEVIKAVIHYTEGREEWSSVEGEIIDNLAMLIRLVTEGDQVIGFTPPDACRAAMLQPDNSELVNFRDRCRKLVGVGSLAPDFAVFTNIENALRRSNCLGVIEHYMSAYVGTDDNDDAPMYHELLNWGEEPSKYIETFKAALPKLLAANSPVDACSKTGKASS